MSSPQKTFPPFMAESLENPDAFHLSQPFDPPKPANRGRRLFVGLVVFFLIAMGYSTIDRAAWNVFERTDFTVYTAAGRAVLEGTNIYDAHNKSGWYYVYPPFFVLFMPAFSLLPLAVGSGLWYAISLAGVAWVMLMSAKLAREASAELTGVNDSWTLFEVPLFLCFPWLASGLMRGQASAFVIVLMIASVYFWWRDKPLWGGASLAGAALIKAFPLALLAYFVWQRQWRFTAAFFLALLLGGLVLPSAVFGVEKSLGYWQQWGKLVAGPAISNPRGQFETGKDLELHSQLLDTKMPRNQSIEAMLRTAKIPPQYTKPALLGVAALMLAAMAWVARRASGKSQLLVVSAFVTWNLLIPPISETHYFGLMLLPLAILTATALGDKDRISRYLAITALALFFIATLWTNLDKDMQLYRLLAWATLAVWGCLMALVLRHKAAASHSMKL